ncbi:hypothetical protein A3F64_01215 [Candidatus Saccharibacteria bacterium RIFCSPHIGHO2_12_FULL_42_8]|nr:MAG: hypothetical protein A3F64_01215 [Candidatus Saccharibacteria bacterium RIFCSPHIGHO2_12_FULL_42_8]
MPDPIDEINSQENNTPLDSPTQQSNFNTQPISPIEPVSTVPSPPSEIAPTPTNTPFVPDEVPKKSYKKLIIGVIAGFVALIGLGGGAAYAMYMNSPDKVLLDATQNLMKANTVITEGSFKADSKEARASISVEFSSQGDNAKQSGSLDAKVNINYLKTKVSLDGAGMVAESGDIYFKVNNVPELVDEALKSEYGKYYATEPAIAPTIEKVKTFAKKIDGQWIKIETTDIDQFSRDYSKQYACTKKALTTFNKSPDQQKQVIDTYSENPFITIESLGDSATINSQDSAAYDISYDAQLSNTFGNELEKTDVMKAVNKCTGTESKPSKPTNDQIAAQQKQANSIKTTLWISQQSHELQKVDIENKDKKSGNVELSITLDTKTQPSLKDPKKYLTFEDIIADITSIGSDVSLLTGGMYGSASMNKNKTYATAVSKKAEAYAADHDGLYPTLGQLKADRGVAELPAELQAVVGSEAPDASHQGRIQYSSCNNGVAYSVFYWDISTNSISEDIGIGFDC